MSEEVLAETETMDTSNNQTQPPQKQTDKTEIEDDCNFPIKDINATEKVSHNLMSHIMSHNLVYRRNGRRSRKNSNRR